MRNHNMVRERMSKEAKQSFKHAVFSIDLIDKLIKDEKDPNKIMLLKKLRTEAKKVWLP